MSKKSPVIAALVSQSQGRELDAHYLAYFECFNRKLYFEAHDVLEELWLTERAGANGSFYKGLIQLAGAFVHLQKNRPQPASSLFKLSKANLSQYSPSHKHLEVNRVLSLIDAWLLRIESNGDGLRSPALDGTPELKLQAPFETAKTTDERTA